MTGVLMVRRCTVPSRAQAPELLARVLRKITCWQPLDTGAVLEDVADALDEVPPAGKDRPDLMRRLHTHLEQLANLALAHGACRDTRVKALIARSQVIRAAAPAALGPEKADLRRAGLILADLVDHLVAMRCVKEPEEEDLSLPRGPLDAFPTTHHLRVRFVRGDDCLRVRPVQDGRVPLLTPGTSCERAPRPSPPPAVASSRGAISGARLPPAPAWHCSPPAPTAHK